MIPTVPEFDERVNELSSRHSPLRVLPSTRWLMIQAQTRPTSGPTTFFQSTPIKTHRGAARKGFWRISSTCRGASVASARRHQGRPDLVDAQPPTEPAWALSRTSIATATAGNTTSPSPAPLLVNGWAAANRRHNRPCPDLLPPAHGSLTTPLYRVRYSRCVDPK